MDRPILDRIHSPADVKSLTLEEKQQLCRELRQEIIETVSRTGGHLASNLGVVELTVAIHSIFHPPGDSIIFDVGHQCYAHKLLTGRREEFHTLRQSGGISGFMRPKESPYDPVISGHSSTSISSALGIARANALLGNLHKTVAVIGDGAMTGGMAFEGLNNCGRDNSNLIIILNDNKMSIGRNVGGFPRHLTKMRTRPSYYRFKRWVDWTVGRLPLVGKRLRNSLVNSKTVLKNAIYHSNLFEDFGLHYLGPVDGHDLPQLLNVLEEAARENRPVLVHVITTKGKGYTPAEKNPGAYHGVSAFDTTQGVTPSDGRDFSHMFGEALCRYAATDPRICAITAAMRDGTGLEHFAEQYKSRFFDVGIAEQHAITFGAGLATAGMLPVFAVYSSFLQRGYDQVVHDAAIAGNHLVLAVDRAGLVGADGETHQGLLDVSFLRSIPGVTVLCPMTFSELEDMLQQALYRESGVVALRYPRGGEPKLPPSYEDKAAPFVLYGDPAAAVFLVSYGREFAQCLWAAEALAQVGISTACLKLNCISPLAAEAVGQAMDASLCLFAEEAERSGGVGEAFGVRLLESGFSGQYCHLAVEDTYVPAGEPAQLLRQCGLDADRIAQEVQLRYGR